MPRAARARSRLCQNFTIEEYANYKLLTVSNAHRNASSISPRPEQERRYITNDLPRDGRRSIIGARVIIMETVYVGYLDALVSSIRSAARAVAAILTTQKSSMASNRGHTKHPIGSKAKYRATLLLQPDLILTTNIGEADGRFHATATC